MELSTCLKALGDPTRFMIFQQLLIRKHCTRSLSRKLGFTEATISQHLKILHEAGLVYKEKYGYHMHYLPTQEALDFLASSFEEMRQASLALNRDPKVCQCEYRQQMENEPVEQILEKEQNSVKTKFGASNGPPIQRKAKQTSLIEAVN
ncbi:MAG: winged helix-turn-helix transcriptional regulator [Clostridia bacterium]|nr:winged helix-turn-helix transcriptional regulator [Clostridia bacterium]